MFSLGGRITEGGVLVDGGDLVRLFLGDEPVPGLTLGPGRPLTCKSALSSPLSPFAIASLPQIFSPRWRRRLRPEA